MPLPKNLTAYNDVAPVLGAAMAANGGSYYLSTRGEAVRWRARAYMYRKVLQEAEDFSLADMILRMPQQTEKGWLVRIERRKVEGILETDGPAEITDEERAAIAALGGKLDV